MRVTESMLLLTTERRFSSVRARLAKAEQQAATGVRVETAADDPVVAGRISDIDAAMSRSEQYQQNMDRSRAYLDSSDGALESMSDLLKDAQELAVSQANGTMSAEERLTGAKNAQSIRDRLIGLANSKYGDRYLFGGYITDQAPFSAAAVYSGDNNRRRIHGAESYTMDVGVTGQEAFQAAGGRDIFADVKALADALSSNNLSGIQASITSLEASHSQIVAARATIGSQQNAFSAQEELLRNRDLVMSTDRSRLTDVDMAQALTEFTEAQNTLNTTVQTTSRILSQLTLVDRL